MIDQKRLESAFKEILEALGENPDREGLVDTPERFAKMCMENFAGIAYSNAEIAKLYDVTFEDETYYEAGTDDFVLMKDIEIFSYCEHHFALMYNMKVAVAYMPKQKVIGLSKITRVADLVGKRLQLQERIGKDIAEIIQLISESEDVAVIIEGEHSCMTTRGIRKPGAKTITKTFRGRFKSEPYLANQIIGLL
ncbi:GTP cyclohydrolase I [Fusibacter sp. 3D3]|uniref:GTP cyclohydrolase I n=1 Tax=Fusibacter sp. 3D3 TaxID=1048380 RepID=UPI00085307D3|nr:GTP cyclohydrolase I [Fusibacter sp. 3D3]GAU76703.1 GTP cyclohydrolase type 1 [Fusibacter sp. 3D3]